MLNLCMLSGSFEYDSEISLNTFKKFVEKIQLVKEEPKQCKAEL